MLLSISARESFVEDLDAYVEAFGDEPEPEAIAAFLIELLETYADENGVEDIVAALEDSGALDGSLSEVLESEMESNDEFECTGEEVVSLLERLCDIEWEEADEDDLDDEVEEEEEEDF